ncbi:prohibitin family protein [Methanosarcina sp. KYL-1]|uniref:prohibitin family protein n=1 Tax=Methanosarcina sp. KYL-1 TaxID=2602068 RepID=UPI0021019AA1|nr:prohibitin family protein [Methanosarcina sp. KYL-1]MCQ1535014.1 prohibitin family protein [Methanosarcina sp. KYL-1]
MDINDDWDEKNRGRPASPLDKIPAAAGPIFRTIALIFVIMIIFSVAFGSIFVSIGAGEVGVKFSQFGGVQADELDEGLHIVPPWVSVTKYSVQSQVYTMSSQQEEGERVGDDRINALTSEGLMLGLDISVRYRMVPSEASSVHQRLGTAYAEKIIRPTIKSVIREVVSSHTAMEVYGQQRQVVATEMQTELESRMKEDGIIVEEVLLRKVELPGSVATAIEQKLQADQEAQRMVFVKQKEELEAERKMIEASGVANATIIQARGEAEALRILNEEIKKNPDLIRYKYIQMLEGQEIQTMIVPSSEGIILDASNK